MIGTKGRIERLSGDQLLVLLTIDEARVRAEIRHENLEGGVRGVPHIYGPLNTDSVAEVKTYVTKPS